MNFVPKCWNLLLFRYDLRVINFLYKLKEFFKGIMTYNWQISNLGNLFWSFWLISLHHLCYKRNVCITKYQTKPWFQEEFQFCKSVVCWPEPWDQSIYIFSLVESSLFTMMICLIKSVWLLLGKISPYVHKVSVGAGCLWWRALLPYHISMSWWSSMVKVRFLVAILSVSRPFMLDNFYVLFVFVFMSFVNVLG